MNVQELRELRERRQNNNDMKSKSFQSQNGVRLICTIKKL